MMMRMWARERFVPMSSTFLIGFWLFDVKKNVAETSVWKASVAREQLSTWSKYQRCSRDIFRHPMEPVGSPRVGCPKNQFL
jgi:hypothetical protein